jgi:hypothetical protein
MDLCEENLNVNMQINLYTLTCCSSSKAFLHFSYCLPVQDRDKPQIFQEFTSIWHSWCACFIFIVQVGVATGVPDLYPLFRWVWQLVCPLYLHFPDGDTTRVVFLSNLK